MAKILVIEDDSEVADSIQLWLESQRHVVELSDNGEDGLHLLRSFGFDAAIIDWELPDFTGVEVVKRYRQFGGLIPIIILTGRRLLDDKESGLDSGADDYLTKPFEMRELGARLRALLRRGSNNKSTEVVFGSIVLDTINRRVTINDKNLDLRPKEFALLEYLIQHPNVILNPHEIVDRLWSSREDGIVDLLRSHITRLRQKIEAADSSVTIEAVYGQGYRLVNK